MMEKNEKHDRDKADPLILKCERIGDQIFSKIEEISGENVFKCMQCGNCSAGCPCHEEFDISPNQIWKYLQMGEYDRIINSKSIWACASCFTCTVRCPKGIDLSKAIEGIRQLVLRKGQDYINPSKLSRKKLEEVPQIAIISAFRKYSS